MTTTMCKQRDRCTRKLLSDGSVPRVLQTLTANALAQFGAGQDLVAYLQDIQYQRFWGSERWSSETQRAQTWKFIDFYCPPCFDVISTIEAVANAAYIKMLHIKPRIRISYLIPASCCPPVRLLDSLNSLNSYLRKGDQAVQRAIGFQSRSLEVRVRRLAIRYDVFGAANLRTRMHVQKQDKAATFLFSELS